MKNKLVLLTSILILSLLFVGCESSDVEVYSLDSPNPELMSMEEMFGFDKMPSDMNMEGMSKEDMMAMMGGGMEKPSTESTGISAEQVEMIVKISAALNEKVEAGELTQDEISEIINKVHSNEMSIQELMGKYGISMK